jgi:hypothetical protein
MSEPSDKPTSQALAAKVVAYRALGMFKEEAREAMIELAKRKDEGDDFDYEKYINEKLEEVPKTQLNTEVIKFMSSLAHLGSAR